MKKLTEKDISREIEKIAKNSAEAFNHKELDVLYAHQVLSGRLGVENEEAQARVIAALEKQVKNSNVLIQTIDETVREFVQLMGSKPKQDDLFENLISLISSASAQEVKKAKKLASDRGRKAVEARHNKPGGSRDLIKKMQEEWASGNYKSRDLCAEEMCAHLNISYSTARRALRNTPTPDQASTT